MTTKTYSDLIRFNLVAADYLKKHEGAENKICFSIKQFTKQLVKLIDDFNDECDTLKINNCAVDEGGVILKDANGDRRFTPAAEIKLKGELKNLLNKEVEITPKIAEGVTDLIKDLTEPEIELFTGIVI